MSYTTQALLDKLKRCKDRLRIEEIECSEIEPGFKFRLRELNGQLIDFWQAYFESCLEDKTQQTKHGSPSQLIIALSAVDSNGDRCFAPHDFKAHAALGELPGVVKDRLAAAAYRLSKMRKVDQEDLEKNSLSTPAEDSTST